MLFDSAHTFKAYMKECPTHPGKEGKHKTNMSHTVKVKIRHRMISNNAGPDLNENIGGSRGLAKNLHRSADLHTRIHPSPPIMNDIALGHYITTYHVLSSQVKLFTLEP